MRINYKKQFLSISDDMYVPLFDILFVVLADFRLIECSYNTATCFASSNVIDYRFMK